MLTDPTLEFCSFKDKSRLPSIVKTYDVDLAGLNCFDIECTLNDWFAYDDYRDNLSFHHG